MLGRNTTKPNTKIRLFFVDAAFLAMTTFAVGAHAELDRCASDDTADILFGDRHDQPQPRYRLYDQQHGVGPRTDESAGMHQPLRDHAIERRPDSQISFEVLLRPHRSLHAYRRLALRLHQCLRSLNLFLRLNQFVACDCAWRLRSLFQAFISTLRGRELCFRLLPVRFRSLDL